MNIPKPDSQLATRVSNRSSEALGHRKPLQHLQQPQGNMYGRRDRCQQPRASSKHSEGTRYVQTWELSFPLPASPALWASQHLLPASHRLLQARSGSSPDSPPRGYYSPLPASKSLIFGGSPSAPGQLPPMAQALCKGGFPCARTGSSSCVEQEAQHQQRQKTQYLLPPAQRSTPTRAFTQHVSLPMATGSPHA